MKRILVIFLLLALLPGQALAAGLEVEAKSAYLMDVATGTVLFAQNENEPLAPASVTKVMTMLLIMEAIDAGVIGWGDFVTASETAAFFFRDTTPTPMVLRVVLGSSWAVEKITARPSVV